MTAKTQNSRQAAKSRRAMPDITKLSLGKLAFIFTSVFSFAVILRNSDIAIEYMTRGIKLCFSTLVPSLFPFMVISELIVASGIGDSIGRLISRPVRMLFGVSGKGACSMLLGAVCGFPVGAKVALSFYDKGEISKKEAERLLGFCNNPSSAFIISAVGVSLFGDRNIGVALYIITLLSSLLVAFFEKLILGNTPECEAAPPVKNKPLGATTFTNAVSSATRGVVTVSSYVIFFSTLVGALGYMLRGLCLSEELSAFIYSFFEVSVGVSEAAQIQSPILAFLLAALALGWSGISVHFQMLSLSDGRGLSCRPYILTKLASAAVSAILAYVYFIFLL